MARSQRFTVYDAMDARGVFDSNPANANARTPQGEALYVGPVQFPRMLYHPKGEERVTVQAEITVTPMGPKLVGEQRELVSKIVENSEEEKKMLAEGWHRHPAQAMAAAGKVAPAVGSSERIAELEAQIATLQREKAGVTQQVDSGAVPVVRRAVSAG